jgi:hypothetical protein
MCGSNELEREMIMSKRIALQRLEEELESGAINWYSGYAEPGYDSGKKGVLVSNWNRYSDKAHRFHYVDLNGEGDYGGEFTSELEHLGYEIEWDDTVIDCECGKLFRTTADSYGWKRYGYIFDGYAKCGDCIKADPTDYLEEIEGDPHKANTIQGLNLESHGYVKLEQEFEHGLYGGQDSDPKVIADSLKALGITRFVFEVDSVGQFDLDFSVYVHESEKDKMPVKVNDKGVDPAVMLEKAFRTLAQTPQPMSEGMVTINRINCENGTVDTQVYTQEQFIQGIK